MAKPTVYMVTNERLSALYISVTDNLARRMTEHRNGTKDDYAKKYGCKTLVYVEHTKDMPSALAREQELKALSRDKQDAIVNLQNPEWNNLSAE